MRVFNNSTLTLLMLLFMYLLVYLIVAWVNFDILIRHKENRTFPETANVTLNKVFIIRQDSSSSNNHSSSYCKVLGF